MTDEQPDIQINSTWKVVIAIAVLAFNGAIIALLIWKGDTNNSLHTSALAWSYMSGLGVLAGIGFGAIAGLLPSLVVKK